MNVSYATGDVLVLVGMVSLSVVAGVGFRPRGLGLLCASFGARLLADLSYVFVSNDEMGEIALWLGALWILSYVLAGMGALIFLRTAARSTSSAENVRLGPRAQRVADLAQVGLPYAAFPAVAALLCLQFLVHEGGPVGDAVTIVLALLLTAMILLRQLVAIIENRRLQASLRSFSESLEVRVAERTRDLAREKERLAMLNRVAEEMSQCLTAQDVVHCGLRLVRRTSGCAHSGLRLKRSGRLSAFFGDLGLTRAGRRQLLAVLRNSQMATAVRDHGGTARIEGAELRACVADQGVEQVFQTVVVLPLVSRRSIHGGLCLGYDERSGPPSEDSIALTQGVASQIAVALENARRYDEVRRLAEQDPVTELLNSRGLARALDRELARSRRAGSSFSLVMMDLDNFKLFNDTYGHAVGDQVLRQTAGVLKKVLRRSDIVGRQGGDEFLALLPDTGTASALECVKHLRDSLSTVGFSVESEYPVPVSLSCGIATYPVDGRRAAELLAVADANVYRSKQKGGDCVTPTPATEPGDMAMAGVFTVLEGLVVAVDNKDHYTRRHSDDVTKYALELAERLGLSSETIRPLRIAGVLHDVGKIGIPDHILRKPGPLDAQEFEAIKQHVSLGELMIKEIPDLSDVLAGVGAHHERWDGGGYPRGLAGDNIPLLGRILAVTDAYSAMTTDRPYRKALTVSEARQEMRRAAGSQLDTRIVEEFLAILDEQELEAETESDEDLIADSASSSAA